ncbi:MAG: carboxypeptidase regulatory-like domain-containing protein [candidate division WOR-3 bacterium]
MFLSVLSTVIIWLIADPIKLTYINEVRVAPDSLEGIEIAVYPVRNIVDVRGWQIRTRAGLATISSSVLPDSFVLINRTNLIGPFGLNDTTDSITLYQNSLIRDGLGYRNSRPSPFATAARFNQRFFYPETLQVVRTYIDLTPTFGQANDDYGSITGMVRDQNGTPVEGATVEAHGPLDDAYTYSRYNPYAGLYYLHGLSKCKYLMTASKPGYTSHTYPDSVTIGAQVNFVLRAIKVEDQTIYPKPSLPREKSIFSPRIGPISKSEFQLYTITGHKISRLSDLRCLASGIYFVVTTEQGVVKSHKVVLIR